MHTKIAQCTFQQHAHRNARHLTCFNCPPDTKRNKLRSLNYAWCSITPAWTLFYRDRPGRREKSPVCQRRMIISFLEIWCQGQVTQVFRNVDQQQNNFSLRGIDFLLYPVKCAANDVGQSFFWQQENRYRDLKRQSESLHWGFFLRVLVDIKPVANIYCKYICISVNMMISLLQL